MIGFDGTGSYSLGHMVAKHFVTEHKNKRFLMFWLPLPVQVVVASPLPAPCSVHFLPFSAWWTRTRGREEMAHERLEDCGRTCLFLSIPPSPTTATRLCSFVAKQKTAWVLGRYYPKTFNKQLSSHILLQNVLLWCVLINTTHKTLATPLKATLKFWQLTCLALKWEAGAHTPQRDKAGINRGPTGDLNTNTLMRMN